MSNRPPRTPKYRHYRPKNLAVVRIDGHDHYLGQYGSQESRERYDRLIAEWLHNGRTIPADRGDSAVPAANTSNGVSINHLILLYWGFAQGYYVKAGQPTDQLYGIKAALRYLRRLYGHTPASEFGPMALKTVRQSMIDAGLTDSSYWRATAHARRSPRRFFPSVGPQRDQGSGAERVVPGQRACAAETAR